MAAHLLTETVDACSDVDQTFVLSLRSQASLIESKVES